MKKRCFSLVAIAGLILALAIIVHGYGSYDMSGEFTDFANANPIDSAYEKEMDAMAAGDWSTMTWIQLEDKYSRLWDNELNASYRRLLSYLSEDEQAVLKESQRGWLQYHLTESRFVKKVFYERKDGQIFGSQGSIQMLQAFTDRIRSRTLELMEYEWQLGKHPKFVFKR